MARYTLWKVAQWQPKQTGITYLKWHSDDRNGWHNITETRGTMISEIATDDKQNLIDTILNYLIEYNLVEEFVAVQHNVSHLQKLSTILIQKIFDSEKAIDLIRADIMFRYFDDIHRAVSDDELKDHISLLYEQNKNIVDRIIDELETVPSHYQLHYSFAQECPEENRESYFEFLVNGLKEMESDKWINHLKKGTELIRLAIFIEQSGSSLNLSIEFRNALESHYKELYEGQIDPPIKELVEKWGILLNGLENDVKDTFLKSILYYLENNEEGMVSNIGYLYDSILIEEKIYSNETGRFISSVFSRVLKKDNEIELKWLKNLITNYPAILKQEKSSTNTFKKEVEHINLEKYSPDSQKEIREIAKELKVKIKTNVDKDQSEED